MHRVRFGQPLDLRVANADRNVPVLPDRDAAILEHQRVPGGETMDPFEERLRAGEIASAEQLGQSSVVGFGAHETTREDCLDLRSEQQAVADPGVVQRLDAKAVACEEQPAPRCVPDRECKHSAKVLDAGIAPLLVGVDQGFGVRARLIVVACGLELGPHVGVVIDLAVEDDPHLAGFVRQRLMAGGQVDDAQPAMGEGGVPVHKQPGIVWSPMSDDVPHRHGAHAVLRLESI